MLLKIIGLFLCWLWSPWVWTIKLLPRLWLTGWEKNGSIIDCDQSDFIKGRYIGSNIRLIMDVIEYTDEVKQIQGALLMLDIEKAFGSVNHIFC